MPEEEVLAQLLLALSEHPDIYAVYPTVIDGRLTVVVRARDPERVRGIVPPQLCRRAEVVVEVGQPYELLVTRPVDHRRRWRPVPGGVSCSHYRLTGAGTVTCWVRDRASGRRLLLSCNHVIALDLPGYSVGRVGDAVLQPGVLDGGRYPRDVVARLLR